MEKISFFDDDLIKVSESVPVLTLPGTILLPGEPLKINIQNEWDKQMVESAINSDRLICIVSAKVSMVKEMEQESALCKVAGLGRIMADEQLPDGSLNLLVLGLRRAKIQKFLHKKMFQRAEIEVLDDRFSQVSSMLVSSLGSELVDLSQQLQKIRKSHELQSDFSVLSFEKMPLEMIPLGLLCDLAAVTLALPMLEKRMILEETDAVKRAEKLILSLRFQLQSYSSGGQGISPTLH